MAYSISPTLKALNSQISKEMAIVLKIEGSQYLYGSAPILETARWDDPRINWDNNIGVTWDGEIERIDSKPYIIMKGSTTKQLSQQLLVDKGGSGSVATMAIELVDYRSEVAYDLSFNQIGDPLGKKAEIFMGLKGSRFPQDYISIMKGYVDDLEYTAGSITVSVALATNLIRQVAFEQYQSQLSAAIDSTQTNIPLISTGQLLPSQDSSTTYIRIDDELMEVLAINPTSVDVIRSRLGSVPAAHDIEADTVSQYYFQDLPMDMALKLLHSKAGNEYQNTDFIITAINRVSSTEVIDGALIISDYDIEASSGLVVGDKVEITGSASNDGEYTVQGFGTLITGNSYILLPPGLIEETGLNIELKIKSKYNVLPDGAGLDLDFIDTAAFEEVKSLYSADFIDMDWFIKDSIEDVREWIISEIMKPTGVYLIPRKAKTSCKKTAPPFTVDNIPVLNTSNLYDMSKIKMKRSTHKYLLNNIVVRYNPGFLEDKFFDKLVRLSADSFNRIQTGRRKFEIEAIGYSRTPEAAQTVDRLTTSILNRYKFGARYIRNIKVLLSVGLQLEIGDIVFFGGSDTQLVNLETGERDLPSAQYEIINKSLNISKGETTLELLETGFGIDGIFGTFSPSSEVLAGSSADRLLLGEMWDSSQFDTEREKWEKWPGLKLRIRSEDYTYDEIATFDRLDPISLNGIILDPPLPSAPPAGAIVELAKYTEYGDSEIEEILKLTHTFTMPQAVITSVTDDKTFEVDDTSDLEEGMEINIHSEDYTSDSQTRIIDEITLNTIVLDSDLDISPAIDNLLEVYSRAEAKGYRFL